MLIVAYFPVWFEKLSRLLLHLQQNNKANCGFIHEKGICQKVNAHWLKVRPHKLTVSNINPFLCVCILKTAQRIIFDPTVSATVSRIAYDAFILTRMRLL